MSLHLLIIFVTLLKVSSGLLNCIIIKDRQPTDFAISEETITATKRKDSDIYQVYEALSSNVHYLVILSIRECFQVFNCTCPIDTRNREDFEIFGDPIKKDLDTHYYRQ